MKHFTDYSKYYDTLYVDKNYREEVDFIKKIIKKISKENIKTILSLGCGTVNHDILLAEDGFNITGVDISACMLKEARAKIKKKNLENSINLVRADVRNFISKTKHDMAMAMFNVVGYQNKNEDMESMLLSVHKSLKEGGLFIFDCWHAPAVLLDRPQSREKKVKDGNRMIIRKTTSELIPTKNLIEINFLVIEEVNKKEVNKVSEIHKMRYWTIPELRYFFQKTGFELLKVFNFMDMESTVSDDRWNIFIVARKKR